MLNDPQQRKALVLSLLMVMLAQTAYIEAYRGWKPPVELQEEDEQDDAEEPEEEPEEEAKETDPVVEDESRPADEGRGRPRSGTDRCLSRRL